MDFEFWNNCWNRPSQPFHIANAHPLLVKHLRQHFVAQEPILVPLSGKSVDLLYLSKEGYRSTAIEFNPKAVEGFIKENGLKPSIERHNQAVLYQFDDFDIWLADFFSLTAQDIGHYNQVFDRAAFVALPVELREQYALHVQSLLKKGAVILMVTMSYDPQQMSGPPFYVSQQELQAFFPEATIEPIDSVSLLDNHPRWQELELDYLDEIIYRITL